MAANRSASSRFSSSGSTPGAVRSITTTPSSTTLCTGGYWSETKSPIGAELTAPKVRVTSYPPSRLSYSRPPRSPMSSRKFSTIAFAVWAIVDPTSGDLSIASIVFSTFRNKDFRGLVAMRSRPFYLFPYQLGDGQGGGESKPGPGHFFNGDPEGLRSLSLNREGKNRHASARPALATTALPQPFADVPAPPQSSDQTASRQLGTQNPHRQPSFKCSRTCLSTSPSRHDWRIDSRSREIATIPSAAISCSSMVGSAARISTSASRGRSASSNVSAKTIRMYATLVLIPSTEYSATASRKALIAEGKFPVSLSVPPRWPLKAALAQLGVSPNHSNACP